MFKQYPGLALVPAAFVLSAVLGEAVHHGPVLCLFRLSTGLPCAGCGLTRAFVALSRGDLDAALGFNLLAPAVYAWLLAWWLLAVRALVRSRPLPQAPRWLTQAGLIVVLGYWVGRVAWFLVQPQPWSRMVADSPMVWLVDRLLQAFG